MDTEKQFISEISDRFQKHLEQVGEAATTESFLKYLLSIGVVHKDTPRYYMVVRRYPDELYKENARRFVAVQKLSYEYDVSIRKIYELLRQNNKKNNTFSCHK